MKNMELIKDYRSELRSKIGDIDQSLVLGTPSTFDAYRFKVGYRAGLVMAEEILLHILDIAAEDGD